MTGLFNVGLIRSDCKSIALWAEEYEDDDDDMADATDDDDAKEAGIDCIGENGDVTLVIVSFDSIGRVMGGATYTFTGPPGHCF